MTKIINLQKIKKADLVVGIPSYNEERTIGFVVKQVSRGLEKYFPEKKAVIINVDNNSSDNTKEVFLGVKIDIPRIHISTPKNIKGKGHNFYNLFLEIRKLKAKAGIVVDADLLSIKPLWIKKLGTPIFNGYEYILPFYARSEDDATITNHLVYPLIYGLLGQNIRQPIGGDFAFSDKLVNIWLKQKWHKSDKQFGIDVFMTLNALSSNVKVCQANLGAKIHKSSAPSLGPMFLQVVESLFKILQSRENHIKKTTKFKKACFLDGKKMFELPDIRPNYRIFEQIFLNNFPVYKNLFKKHLSIEVYQKIEKFYQKKQVNIDLDLWVKIVYEFFNAYKLTKSSSIIKALECLYFGRVASFFKQTANLTPAQSEREVLKQAQHFFKNREYFLK
ncbi:glycosyltransferase [Candidatus Parcubacteria bacterium]|nr:glycosyltransferase [Candidatus Parcubacteria bacterium]